MLAEKTQKHLLCLSMEWVIIGLLYYYVCLNKSHKMQNIILCYYFFQPASAMLILSGDIRGICVSSSCGVGRRPALYAAYSICR